jgi:hypothetical protein
MFLRNPNIGTVKTFKEIVDGKETSIDESSLPDPLNVPELTNVVESTTVQESPEPLPLESVARELETELKKQQEKSIAAMERKHNHKRNKRTISFSVGEMVSVSIPHIDRVGCDFPRLPVVVSEVKHEMYVLVSKYGILDVCYRADDLESFSGQVDFEYKSIENKISLRSAAQLFNKRAHDKSDTNVSCNCNGRCSDKRCNCYSRSLKCNTHCHLKSHTNICCNREENN